MYVTTFPATQIEAASLAAPTKAGAPITVRALQSSDSAGLERLAGRDSSAVPVGRVIGAEVDGALVAAISLDDGRVLADPFRSTRAAVELLRLRVDQLRSQRRRWLPRF